jgi:hypothetical protein
MFRYIRIAALLTVLLVVAGNQFLTGSRFSSWDRPLWISIYPVLADQDGNIRRYAESLNADSFQGIGNFLKREAARYGRQLDTPVVIQVARPLTSLPPALPTESSGLGVALWSLKMRWWSYQNGGQDGLAPDDIRMFVVYQKGQANTKLERSVGMKNGSYGVVNAIASRAMAARNRIVISHELMHILGASDKYDLYTGQPLSPDGLANPNQAPLYPQRLAEIMAGRIATSATHWRRAASLKSCVVGAATATEIGWSHSP